MDSDMPWVFRDRWLPHGTLRKTGDKYVAVSPTGDWEFLNEEEASLFLGVGLPRELFDRLSTKRLIITEGNANAIVEQNSRWNARKFGGVSLHIVETTRNCNLKCAYCHASAASPVSIEDFRGNNLEKDTATAIVDFIFQSESEALSIEFQGGESLLNFDVVRHVVAYAKEKNKTANKELSFSLVSNLVALTREYCKFLKEEEIGYCSSLDGPEWLHDAQRTFPNGHGSFLHFVRALKLLQSEGLRPPGTIATITAKTMPHWQEIVEMFITLGVSNLVLNFVNPLGFAHAEWDELGVSIDDEIATYYKLFDYIFQKFAEGVFIEERMLSMTLAKILSNTDVGFMDFRNPCGLAYNVLAYCTNGDIHACDEGRSNPRFRLGNVRETSLRSLTRSRQALELSSESMPNYVECRNCAYRAYCVVCPVLNQIAGHDGPSCQGDTKCRLSQALFDYCFTRMATSPALVRSYMVHKRLQYDILQ